MIKKLKWEEFRDTGMLFFINQILHLFGRAICFDYDNKGNLKEVFFARCKFRGFSDDCINKGYKNLTKYLKKNMNELEKDILL